MNVSIKNAAAIIGGGIIGGGWAARFLLNGWDVRIFDPDPDAARKIGAVLDNARRSLPALSDLKMPDPGKLTFCKTLEDAATDTALIIEAVPERLEIKQAVYAQIEAVNETGVIASSTSGIMPTDLQAKLNNPGRLIVAHPFNPVYLLPLVELVAGKETDAKHIEWAKTTFADLGMYPLHCRVEIEGFLSDRLQEALWREALWLLKDGVATAAELDAAIAYGPGLRWAQMGTMQTFHLAGGEGGMRAMLAMFGPCLKWPWTKLMDVPELTDDFVEMVGGQCDAQSGDLNSRDLEKIRDDNLVGIIRALKRTDWGAGALANQYDVNNAPEIASATDALIQTQNRQIPQSWTDYNGHMNETHYLEVFAAATDRLMMIVGADAKYIASGNSYFTAETHIRHIDEVHAGSQITVQTQVLNATGKKLHVFHRMFQDDRLLATGEHMLLHVNLNTRATSQPLDNVAASLAKFEAAHANLSAPDGAGRSVGQRPEQKG